MKKRLTFLFAAILAAASLWAQEFQSGDLKYNVISRGNDGNAVEVIKSNNASLTEVVIPATVEYEGVEYSVTRIGYNAFSNCFSLASVAIPEGVTTIGENAFYYCLSIVSVILPESVTTIGDGAFNVCTHLVSITIPKGVTSIGEGAFGYCYNLETITIPEGVTSIGEGAFDWCYGLESIKVESGNKVYDSRNNCNAIIMTERNELIRGCNNTLIPESVTNIGVGAFNGCYSLVSIIIPEGVTRIGNGAFDGCSGFESIKVENGNKFYDSRGNCNAIIVTESNELLWGCNNTFIPESVTGIGDNAFNSCFGLTSIKIPEGVTRIGDYAFKYCI